MASPIELGTWYNFAIENCRKEEFPHIRDSVYVDHAGAALYSKSQLAAVHSDLTSHLYGNPHSHNPSSRLATDTVDQIRYRLLRFFNTNPDEYSLIFTSGCTAALKIVADGFKFQSDGSSSSTCHPHSDAEKGGIFCFLMDSHTSVQGMRETVGPQCSGVHCLDEGQLQSALGNSADSISSTKCTKPTTTPPVPSQHQGSGDDSSSVDPSSTLGGNPQSLVAFPAQSNFSGRKYPLSWVSDIQSNGLCIEGRRTSENEKWFVLLDAAAFVSTSKLDLSQSKPDFITLSFYKIFGYPTGLGALLVNKRAWDSLAKTYFGGGNVAMSTARERFHAFRTVLHERFEDGTLNFLDIISLRHGLDTIQRLAGGMDRLSQHVFIVAQFFFCNLRDLRHGNGQPLAQIYGDLDFVNPKGQGGTVTFNLQRSDGSFVGFAEIDKFAQLHDVHLRTGCFCNIGACQQYLNLTSKVIRDNFAAGHTCGDNMDLINGLPTGAVRISFGYMNTLADARACLRFLADSFLENTKESPAFPNPEWYTAARSENGISILSEKHAEIAVEDSTINGKIVDKDESPLMGTSTISAASVSQTCSESVRKVTDIVLYPVKSCGPFRVSEWEMGTKGLLYDREWILVSDTGVTIGQKREPKICMLRPHIDLVNRKLVLHFPECEPFVLPLDQEGDFEAMSSLCTNKVCGDRVNTFDCGEEVSDWLSLALETSGVRLLRQQSDDTRKSKLRDVDAPTQGPDKPRLSMANESQLLLVSRASVRTLQAKMAEVVENGEDTDVTRMATAPGDISEENLLLRFRGNLIIDGGKAFEEENWTSVMVGEEKLVCQGPCARCQMICMDQETAIKSREPLRSLITWRGKKAPFGVHSRILPRTDGSKQMLHVGDMVVL